MTKKYKFEMCPSGLIPDRGDTPFLITANKARRSDNFLGNVGIIINDEIYVGGRNIIGIPTNREHVKDGDCISVGQGIIERNGEEEKVFIYNGKCVIKDIFSNYRNLITCNLFETLYIDVTKHKITFTYGNKLINLYEGENLDRLLNTGKDLDGNFLKYNSKTFKDEVPGMSNKYHAALLRTINRVYHTEDIPSQVHYYHNR